MHACVSVRERDKVRMGENVRESCCYLLCGDLSSFGITFHFQLYAGQSVKLFCFNFVS